MGTISTVYRPYDPLNLCSICGTLARKSELRKIPGGLYACNREPCASWRPAIELDRANARSKPFRILPVPDARPSVWNLPDSYESDEGEILNFLQRAVTAGVRFESVVSGDPAPLTGQQLPAYGWIARYLYGLIVENKRPVRMIVQAKAMLTTIATGLQARQTGFGISPTSTRATDAFYGGFLESGATAYQTQDAASCGLAMLYAYRVLGALTYRDSARAAASYLRNVQAIGMYGTHYTSSDSAGTARLYTGAVASSVSAVSGFYSNSLFYPQDLMTLEFWNALTVTDGDQSIGATAAVTGFTATPAQLMSTSITDMRAFWTNGVLDSAGDTFTGLSSTTPREYFNAYPAVKTNFSVTGTGRWEFVDGGAATGTTISAQNFAGALAALYAYEGASEQVTTISDWLRTFTSNTALEATGRESASEFARSTVGTFDPTWAPTTVLLVRDSANSYAAMAKNGSSLYDWGALGVLSALWGARNTSSFTQARLSPLGRNQRFYDGQRSDGDHFDWITNRGLSGLGLQTAFASSTSNPGPTQATSAGAGSGGSTTMPSTGLVFWTKGDYQLVSAIGPGGPELDTQGNAAIPSFNPGLRSKGAPGGGYGPLTGIDMLDGVPGTTWSTDRAGEVVVVLEPPDGSGAQQLKDRNGVPFVPGISTLTWLAVVIARISTTFGNNLGGTIFSLGNTAANAGQDIEPLFNIGPGYGGPADGFFLFSNEWPGLYGYTNALKGADQPGFETGPYVDVPLLLHYESVGTTFRAYVSGPGIGTMVPIALSSSTIPAPAPVGLVNFAYGCTNRILGPFHTDHWVGARFEDICFDIELSTNPTGLTQAYGYFGGRFPSLGIVTNTTAMTNDAVRSAQFAQCFRVNPTVPAQV